MELSTCNDAIREERTAGPILFKAGLDMFEPNAMYHATDDS